MEKIHKMNIFFIKAFFIYYIIIKIIKELVDLQDEKNWKRIVL